MNALLPILQPITSNYDKLQITSRVRYRFTLSIFLVATFVVLVCEENGMNFNALQCSIPNNTVNREQILYKCKNFEYLYSINKTDNLSKLFNIIKQDRVDVDHNDVEASKIQWEPYFGLLFYYMIWIGLFMLSCLDLLKNIFSREMLIEDRPKFIDSETDKVNLKAALKSIEECQKKYFFYHDCSNMKFQTTEFLKNEMKNNKLKMSKTFQSAIESRHPSNNVIIIINEMLAFIFLACCFLFVILFFSNTLDSNIITSFPLFTFYGNLLSKVYDSKLFPIRQYCITYTTELWQSEDVMSHYLVECVNSLNFLRFFLINLYLVTIALLLVAGFYFLITTILAKGRKKDNR
ncbi:MAG: hypothetical protein MHMPM18_003729 [Marteilia pararefringens]